ncbi:hypothetical protein IB265_34660 [Ensifer sp. ENS10]|uniref:hypothetical protein n=1 Tax=Ensifer sp. ENS10 TaxID=2769286 RepID=UPI001783939F|nr:hypothetical protein [Ensifer sp. ENS10]MBD9511893.1 hypothetical protein [Ensifer sp. ENS10]
METIIKFFSTPLVGVALSIMGIIGAVAVPLLDYKIKHFNKRRYTKYLIGELRLIHNTLFQRRDAFFAYFIYHGVGVVIFTMSIVSLWTIGVILSILGTQNPDSMTTAHTIVFWTVSLSAIILSYVDGKAITRFKKQMQILKHPKLYIEGLRTEVLTGAKRSLLDPEEIEEYKRTFTQLSEALPRLRKMAFTADLKTDATEKAAIETPASPESVHPTQ